jgi:Tryptophan/tyrosine permease family
MAHHTLGSTGASITSLVYLFLSYSLLIAYITKGSQLFTFFSSGLMPEVRCRHAHEGTAKQTDRQTDDLLMHFAYQHDGSLFFSWLYVPCGCCHASDTVVHFGCSGWARSSSQQPWAQLCGQVRLAAPHNPGCIHRCQHLAAHEGQHRRLFPFMILLLPRTISHWKDAAIGRP